MPVVDLSQAVWRKSSRSGGGNNSNCVEVAFAEAVWRKSSRSGNGNNDNCVEVALAGPVVAVRDSKDPHSAVLAFSADAWSSFLRTLARN